MKNLVQPKQTFPLLSESSNAHLLSLRLLRFNRRTPGQTKQTNKKAPYENRKCDHRPWPLADLRQRSSVLAAVCCRLGLPRAIADICADGRRESQRRRQRDQGENRGRW